MTMWTPEKTRNPWVGRILKAAYPSYKGRKFRVAELRESTSLTSYRDGGSRSYYCLINAKTLKRRDAPQNGSGPWDPDPISTGDFDVFQDEVWAVAEHSIFRGKDMSLIQYVRKERLEEVLREQAEERDPPTSEWTPSGTFTEGRHIQNALELTFPEKPPAWVRKALINRRWRWSARHRCWYRFCAIDRDKEVEFTKALTTPAQDKVA